MPRRGLRPRERRGFPAADFKYQSQLVSRFINKINFQGKKSTAERVVYDAMAMVGEKSGQEPLAVFTQAIENVRPLLEVKARRVGGATGPHGSPPGPIDDAGHALAHRRGPREGWAADGAAARRGASRRF